MLICIGTAFSIIQLFWNRNHQIEPFNLVFVAGEDSERGILCKGANLTEKDVRTFFPVGPTRLMIINRGGGGGQPVGHYH